MNKLFASAIVAAGVAMPALAQQWQYEYRLIADGDFGAPVVGPQFNFSLTATQIGFWVQARVLQTGGGQNWGIGRATAPGVPNNDFIVVTDSVASTQLNRGRINTAGTARFGRGTGYRFGGAADNVSQNTAAGNNGNNTGANTTPSLMPTPFATGATNDENGAFDMGNDRIYGFDAYVDGTRNTSRYLDDINDPLGSTSPYVDPLTGNPTNPWGVNGGSAPPGVVVRDGDGFAISGSSTANLPVPQGVFSPWANLYRFVVIITDTTTLRTVTLNSTAQLNGTVQAAPSAAGGTQWAMQLSTPFLASTSYSWTYVPTPGAAALLGLGGLAVARRRRA